MEKLKMMKDSLVNCVMPQINGKLNEVDAKELGEAVDMIKDLEEAIYYCTITKAMEENKEQKMNPGEMAYYRESKRYPDYYRDMDRDMGRMYYDGGSVRPRMYTDDGNSNPSAYMRDVREGRSGMSRRNYMEAKELHQDKAVQMRELDKYLQELSSDITEMVQNATPDEKAILQQKISTLA